MHMCVCINVCVYEYLCVCVCMHVCVCVCKCVYVYVLPFSSAILHLWAPILTRTPELTSLWLGAGASPPSPAACPGLGPREPAGLSWGGHLIPHSVPGRRKAASPQSLLCPCSLSRADGAHSSLLLWTPISLTRVCTVIEEGRPMCTTLCNTVSAWTVGGWVVHALGCVLASPGGGTLHRRTVQPAGGGQAKVSVRSTRRHAQLGSTSKCGRSRKGNQCWARALLAAAAGVCRDPLGAQVLAPPVWEPGALFTWACMPCGGRAPGPAGAELPAVHGDGSRQELGTLNSGPETAQARACSPTKPTSTEPW